MAQLRRMLRYQRCLPRRGCGSLVPGFVAAVGGMARFQGFAVRRRRRIAQAAVVSRVAIISTQQFSYSNRIRGGFVRYGAWFVPLATVHSRLEGFHFSAFYSLGDSSDGAR